MTPERLTKLVYGYVKSANIGKLGSCHLFRHTMATLMLEGGADIRYVQAMLGHADITTTQIYTRVSVRVLKDIHQQTHPGATSNTSRRRASSRPRAPLRKARTRTRRGRRAKLGL
jgi:integrase/recombinase XerD